MRVRGNISKSQALGGSLFQTELLDSNFFLVGKKQDIPAAHITLNFKKTFVMMFLL